METAASYMRCSSYGAIWGDTWERQSEAIRACAKSKGFDLAYEFKESAIPGKADAEERPAFLRMIATLSANGCRTVIVESLDRLARAYRVQEELIIHLASEGLTLISVNTGENITEAMMGDPMRRALVQIQGILAELDKNMIVAKLRKARERMRATGQKVEGRKSFGAKPGEELILATIQSLALNKMTGDDIAKYLNNRQVTTRSGKLWRGSVIRKILARERTLRNLHDERKQNDGRQ